MSNARKFELVWVSDRTLCGDFERDLGLIASSGAVDKILLRERDLDVLEYEKLAVKALKIIAQSGSGMQLIIHSHADVAARLGVRRLHLPFAHFVKFSQNSSLKQKLSGLDVGVSVHSLDEAVKAQNLGASYVVAGHIFATKSHEKAEPRGLGFLAQICRNLRIKTYAIGGINFKNLDLVQGVGASGAYMMRAVLERFVRDVSLQ